MISSSQTSSTATALPPSFRHSSSSRSSVKSFTFGAERKVGCLAMKSDDALPRDDGSNVYGEIPNTHRIVQVPRQKYIPVPKAELLDAIVATMFDSHHEALQFIDVSACLDSILHAEHKTILEEMRADYSVVSANFLGMDRSVADDADSSNSASIPSDSEGYVDLISGGSESIPYKQFSSIFRRELENLFNFPVENVRGVNKQPRLANATRFQRTFMQLLRDAQFEELSARDLMLVSALNTDYLLTLPIFVDWKKASQSNAIIFRRGYATENQKGLLLAEKLDYIQSRLLQGIFFIISKPLANVGSWIAEKLKSTDMNNELKDRIKKLKNWLSQVSDFPKSDLPVDDSCNSDFEVGSPSDQELPIWFAAQRAVTSYKQLLSSAGPRGRLLGKLLIWAGLLSPAPETQFELQEDDIASEPYLRPNFLSRIALNDLWRPAREKWYSDSWEAFKTAVSILFSPSALQEAAFQELILLYTTEVDEKDSDSTSRAELQLKIYERIPIPDLPVIFPHKKLSFRIIDTVRLDAATVLGLLAYFVNYKFEDVSSSPSAIVLDVIAVTALIVFVTRVVLGYKQTWDRYQLLVNKTLYEKTLASGFGSIHFLLDASEQQQYKEAILAYAMLLGSNNNQVKSRRSVGDECERFIYNVFKQKVEMAVEKAIDTLLRLGLAIETPGSGALEAIPCPKAHETLRQRWDTLLSSSQTTMLKHK